MPIDKIRDEIAEDFRVLATLLNDNRVSSDVSPLYRAASNIQTEGFLLEPIWGYKLEGLSFQLDRPSGTMPTDLDNFVIDLSVMVTIDSTTKPDDPFKDLQVNIQKSVAKKACNTILKAAWHLDKHIYERANSIHPLYHFQLGGQKIKELEGDLGRTFITTAPRIMHPPMEVVIAVDFILANYWYNKWYELKANSSYDDIVNRAYHRYWGPFFRRLGKHFETISLEENDNAMLLCPSFKRRL